MDRSEGRFFIARGRGANKSIQLIVAIESRRWIEFLIEVLPRHLDVGYAELPAV